MTAYCDILAKSALHRVQRMPYNWDLNIYRGCEHSCQYCYARYSHRYLDEKDFFGRVFIKTNIAEVLDRELTKNPRQGQIINIGGVTDAYQPVEAGRRIMPGVLEVLIKHRTAAIISTKSDLILRDAGLLDQLSRVTFVNVAVTLLTADREISEKIEPGAVSPMRRINILAELKKTGTGRGLHVMPVLPFITDRTALLDDLFSRAVAVGVDYVLPGPLNLRGHTRDHYFSFIKNTYADHFDKYQQLYKNGFVTPRYRSGLRERVNLLLEKHGLSADYMAGIRAWRSNQMMN